MLRDVKSVAASSSTSSPRTPSCLAASAHPHTQGLPELRNVDAAFAGSTSGKAEQVSQSHMHRHHTDCTDKVLPSTAPR